MPGLLTIVTESDIRQAVAGGLDEEDRCVISEVIRTDGRALRLFLQISAEYAREDGCGDAGGKAAAPSRTGRDE